MAKTNLSPKATYVTRGYGQVEPNLLSAQKTGQIYAQLPAAATIDILENGQFATYNYAAADGGAVDFAGAGEWMMVFNEVKVYRDEESDCDFAMKKENYVARIYSPIDGTQTLTEWQTRFYGPTDSTGQPNAERVTTPADPFEYDSTDDPFHHVENYKTPKAMPAGTRMVPRLFKINVGDIWTTNTIKAAPGSLQVGQHLTPDADGYLKVGDGVDAQHPTMQIVKVYTMPDMQPGVKVMRIK
jgi:hypothetical protein